MVERQHSINGDELDKVAGPDGFEETFVVPALASPLESIQESS